jgi:Ca2+-binding RTX toxin-like protein
LAFTTVTGSNGVTSLVGTSGIDVATIVTLNANVFVGGQGADDIITADLSGPVFLASKWTLNGGAGSDTITFRDNVLNSIVNGDGGTGTAGDDIFNFAGGVTVINSAVSGGSGNDQLNFVNYNNSTVNGNAGTDTIFAAGSASFIYGGQDTDIISITDDSSALLVNGNKGSDTITIGAVILSSSSLYGGSGNDIIDASAAVVASAADGAFISGDLGDDTAIGTNGLDTILGGDGSDRLFGLLGIDGINGGAGSDSITGGLEGDTLTGGGGQNIFNYLGAGNTDSTVSGNTGFDTITDFVANTSVGTPNGDRLDLGFAVSGIVTQTLAGGATLESTLLAGVAYSGNRGVSLVTITGAVSFAGNYIVMDTSEGGAYTPGSDNVIKVNNLANIGVATFI